MNIFTIWNTYKENLDKRLSVPVFHSREIWWCALGKNIGHEQDGKNELFERPVLILQKFSKEVCVVIPITSTDKEGKYYYELEMSDSRVILSQIRLISAKRLLRFIKTISRTEFNIIKQKVKDLL
jgi:mRNA interferase MazF